MGVSGLGQPTGSARRELEGAAAQLGVEQVSRRGPSGQGGIAARRPLLLAPRLLAAPWTIRHWAPIPTGTSHRQIQRFGPGRPTTRASQSPLAWGLLGFPVEAPEPARGPRGFLLPARQGEPCSLLPRGLRTSRAVSLIFTGFSQPQLAPAPFYLLGCTWLIYFVRLWEPESGPGMGRPVDRRARACILDCPERPREDGNRKRAGGERGNFLPQTYI